MVIIGDTTEDLPCVSRNGRLLRPMTGSCRFSAGFIPYDLTPVRKVMASYFVGSSPTAPLRFTIGHGS
jgi:hypothetical protein